MNNNTTMPGGYDDMFIKSLIIKFDFLSIASRLVVNDG